MLASFIASNTSWLSPSPAPLLVSSGSWDTPTFSRTAALQEPLNNFLLLSVAFLHAESSWRFTFLFPPRFSPVSLQSNSHPKSFLHPAFLGLSLRPVIPFPHLPVQALLTLPEPGWGLWGGRSCLVSGMDQTCDLDFSNPQLCLSGNPAQPLAGAHPERGKVSGSSAGKLFKTALREHM